MVHDPVCGMTVNQDLTEYRSDYKGRSYYFCNETCKTKFDKDPKSYYKGKGIIACLLDWIIKGNDRVYHGHPPNCCG